MWMDGEREREREEVGDALDYSPRADTLRHCAPLSEHAISDAGISRTSDNYCPNGTRMWQDRITRFLRRNDASPLLQPVRLTLRVQIVWLPRSVSNEASSAPDYIPTNNLHTASNSCNSPRPLAFAGSPIRRFLAS